MTRQEAEGRRQKGRGFWATLLFVTCFGFFAPFYLGFAEKERKADTLRFSDQRSIFSKPKSFSPKSDRQEIVT